MKIERWSASRTARVLKRRLRGPPRPARPPCRAPESPTKLKSANLLEPRRAEILEREAGTMLARSMAMKKVIAALALLFSACEPHVEGARGDEPMMEARLRATESPVSFALVIDDTNDASAAELRANVVSALEHAFRSSWFGERGACRDPAAACPVDLRLVLARPSADPGVRILGPATWPALRWSTKWATEPALDAYLAELRQALETPLAPEGAPYRPLEAADDLMRLLLGLRAPSSEIEAAIVADVASDEPWIELVLASARDDESPRAPAAYTWPDELPWLSTLMARGEDADACEPHVALRGRLGAWAERARPVTFALPCDDRARFDEVFTLSCHRAVPRCTEHPVAIDARGRADCRVFARSFETAACEAARGWLDPEDHDGIRRPRFEDDEEGRPTRICEIVQHEGARLEACRTDLSCPECGSGFCKTDVPELAHSPVSCGWGGGHPLDLRFTGAASVNASEILVRCRPALAKTEVER